MIGVLSTGMVQRMLTSETVLCELCSGKVMVAHTKPEQWKKDESKCLRGERGQKFTDLRFERLQVVRFIKARRR